MPREVGCYTVTRVNTAKPELDAHRIAGQEMRLDRWEADQPLGFVQDPGNRRAREVFGAVPEHDGHPFIILEVDKARSGALDDVEQAVAPHFASGIEPGRARHLPDHDRPRAMFLEQPDDR